MTTYSDIVKDDVTGQPVANVSVYVYNLNKTLATVTPTNPVITDSYGEYSFTAADGIYRVSYIVGGKTVEKDYVLVGAGPSVPIEVTTALIPILAGINVNVAKAAASEAASELAAAAAAVPVDRFFADTTAGLAGTTNGQLFYVKSGDGLKAALYKNNSGTATPQNWETPSYAAVQGLVDVPGELAGQTYWGALDVTPAVGDQTGSANTIYFDPTPLPNGATIDTVEVAIVDDGGAVTGQGIYKFVIASFDSTGTVTVVSTTFDSPKLINGYNVFRPVGITTPTTGTWIIGFREVYSFTSGPTYRPTTDGSRMWFMAPKGAGNDLAVGNVISGVSSGFQLLVRVTFNTPAKGTLQLQADHLAVTAPPSLAAPVSLATGDKVTLLTSGWNMWVAAGQSLAEGFASQPALSTVAPYTTNKTFGGGPRSGKPGNIVGAGNTSPGTTTIIPLIENNLDADPDFAAACGETMCTIGAAQINNLALKDAGIAPANLPQFVSCIAHGAYRIGQLNKGSLWYNVYTDHISEAIARAKGAGVDIQFVGAGYIQGEADADAGTTRAAYAPLLTQYRADLETDYHTILTANAGGSVTAKSNPVHLFVLQTSTWGAGATLPQLEAIALAQMDAAASDPRIHIVGPGYPLARNSDRVHLPNYAEQVAGRYIGRAMKQAYVEGRVPDNLHPLRAWAAGLTVSILYSVPQGPLVLDDTMLGRATNYGFGVKDDTGTLTVSNVAVSGNIITMTVSRTLTTNPKVRYGLDYNGSAVAALLGFFGNLRDSTPTLPHWGLHTETAIAIVES